jgi:hypothetical protein
MDDTFCCPPHIVTPHHTAHHMHACSVCHATPHNTALHQLARHCTTRPYDTTLQKQNTATGHRASREHGENAKGKERKDCDVVFDLPRPLLSCPLVRQTLTTRACSEESFDVRVKVGLVLIIFFLRRDEIHPIKRREVNRGRCLVRRCSCRRPRNARRPTATSGRGRWG